MHLRVQAQNQFLWILFAINFCDVANFSESKIEICQKLSFFNIQKNTLFLSPGIGKTTDHMEERDEWLRFKREKTFF